MMTIKMMMTRNIVMIVTKKIMMTRKIVMIMTKKMMTNIMIIINIIIIITIVNSKLENYSRNYLLPQQILFETNIIKWLNKNKFIQFQKKVSINSWKNFLKMNNKFNFMNLKISTSLQMN